MQHSVFLGLGSNLENPIQQLKQAITALQKLPTSFVIAVSPFYESKPMGPQNQPNFINAVVQLDTFLEPLNLLQHTKAVEKQHKRVKTEHWGPRTIDIDILFYGKKQIYLPELIIPHPGIEERNFVILPLFDLAPNLRLPNGKMIRELYQYCASMSTPIA